MSDTNSEKLYIYIYILRTQIDMSSVGLERALEEETCL